MDEIQEDEYMEKYEGESIQEGDEAKEQGSTYESIEDGGSATEIEPSLGSEEGEQMDVE